MQTLEFAAGDILWRHGEPGGHALLIERGTVEVVNPDTAGGVLATFGPGDVVGELALIDERPRTHTVQTRTSGQALLLRREELQQALLSNPQQCLPFVLALLERLRRLEPRPPAVLPAASGTVRPQTGWRLCLLPLSHHTASLLPDVGLVIDHFPFHVGRPEEAHERPSQSLNDLWLLDKQPFIVSRNHITFFLLEGPRYVVRDGGSQLGTTVNEKKIGANAPKMEAELGEGDNVIILGPASSPFKFRAVLERDPM